jgi:hypothetical protein
MFGILGSLSFSHRRYSDNGFSTVRWDQAKVLSTGGTTAAPLVGFGLWRAGHQLPSLPPAGRMRRRGYGVPPALPAL